jgi:hypothetical protein
VAEKLALNINSHANYNASSSGSEITITGQTTSDVITRLASTVAEPLVANSGTVTSNGGNTSYTVTLSGTVSTQDYWGLVIADGISPSAVTFDFWPTATQTSLTTVARFLAKKIDDYPTLSAVANGETISITRQTGGALSTVTLKHALANGRIPTKTTDYRQRYDNAGSPVTRTYMSLQGLGLASGTAFDSTTYGGVLIQNIENMDIRFGFDGANDTKSDNFTLKTTVLGTTTLVLGGGNDVASVEAVQGETRVLGGSGNDTVNVYDNTNRVQYIESKLVTDGDMNLKDDIRTVLYADLDPFFKAVVDTAPMVFRRDNGVVGKVPIVTQNGAEVWVNVAKIDPVTGQIVTVYWQDEIRKSCLLYTSPSPRDV